MREIKKLEMEIDDLKFGLWDEDAQAKVTDPDDMAAMLECVDVDDANRLMLDSLSMFCADLKEQLQADLGTLWDEIQKSSGTL